MSRDRFQIELCSEEVLHERVLAIHAGSPERFTLPCNFRTSQCGKNHALLVRAGETIAVGSSSADGSGARLITSRLDRPRPDQPELSALIEALGGPGEIVIEEALSEIADEATRSLSGRRLEIHLELDLYRYQGGAVHGDQTDPDIRIATAQDTQLIAQWLREFDGETGFQRSTSESDYERVVDGNLKCREIRILEAEGTPVAMGQRARFSTVGQNRIGLIYVPEQHRSRGYARRVVQSLVHSVLYDDAVPCLFADRSNPISHRLYTGLSFIRTERLVHLKPHRL